MPEYNQVQRPDLIHRLQQFLGIRQAHLTPTLAPTLVPVVVVADIDRDSVAGAVSFGHPTAPLHCFGNAYEAGNVGQVTRALLRNPAGSGVRVRVHRLNVDTETQSGFGIWLYTKLSNNLGSVSVNTTGVDTRFLASPTFDVFPARIPPQAVLSSETNPAAHSGAPVEWWLQVQQPMGPIDVIKGTHDGVVLVEDSAIMIELPSGQLPLQVNLAWSEDPIAAR